jgi:hypothetical protein
MFNRALIDPWAVRAVEIARGGMIFDYLAPGG